MALQKRTGRMTAHKCLVVLLLASFLNGLCWTGLIPMWQTPDEQAHFAQSQNMMLDKSEREDGPWTSRDIMESEKLLGTFRIGGNNSFTYHPEYRIQYSMTALGLYEKDIESFPLEYRKDFIAVESTGYPPLYYGLVGGVNKLFWNNGLITRVFASRILTVLISTLAVYIIYLLANEIFRNKYLALATAAMVSFHPMWRFVESGITSDAMMNLVYPLLVLSFLYFWRGKRWGLRLSLAVFILSLITKVQSLLFLTILVPGIAIYWVKGKYLGRLDKFLILMSTKALVLTGLIITGNYIFPKETLNLFDSLGIKEANYWFYLPELSVFESSINLADYLQATGNELYRQTFPWYWGVYRWLSLTLPLWVYRMMKIMILVSGLGWFIAGIRGIKGRSGIREIVNNNNYLLVIALSSVAYAGGILVWNYFFWRGHGYSFGIQGRYFFPNLPEHVILLLTGFLLLPLHSMFKKIMTIVLVFGMMIFSWYSLYFVSASYYDVSSWNMFFVQASQYKPWFFKTPILPVIIFLGIASSVWLLVSLVKYNKGKYV